MKSNALLKWGGIVIVFLIIAFVVWPKGSKVIKQVEHIPGPSISSEEAKILGIEGDTPKDTLATLVGQMKSVKSEIDEVKKQNDALKQENERLRSREANVDARVDLAVKKAQGEFDKVTGQAKDALGDLRGKIGQFGHGDNDSEAKSSTDEDLPVGLGLQAGDGKKFNTPFDGFNIPFGKDRQQTANNNASAAGGTVGSFSPLSPYIWIEPSDGLAIDPKTNKPSTQAGTVFPNSFTESGPLGEISSGQRQLRLVAKGERDTQTVKKRNDETKQYYTIAENSTLMGSKVMTALIGRVPIDGTVNDPYPFKVLIGKDNLAANGIELPDVTGAVMTGMATGDWTLSCVRGQIDSITFVFDDGTIRTVPEPDPTLRRGQSANDTSANLSRFRGGIGYISDPQGVPCISGVQRSNAQQYLTTHTLVTAAGAAVASVFSRNDSGMTGNYTGSGTIVSDRNQALNTILTGGVQDISNWVNKLYGQAFAAIYVPPHAEVAVHIDHELTIDYEPHGRKVNYHANEDKNSADLD